MAMDTNVDLAVDEDQLLESSPTKSSDALFGHDQSLLHNDLKEGSAAMGEANPGFSYGKGPIMDDEKEGCYDKLKKHSDEEGQVHEVSDDPTKLSSTPRESDLGSAAMGEVNPGFSYGKGRIMDDEKEGCYDKLKKHSDEEGQVHEVSDDPTKLSSTPRESDLGSAAIGEANPGFSYGKGPIMDDEKEGCYDKLKKHSDEEGQGSIVGSLAGEGSKLLNMDLRSNSDYYHCFTVQEIKHVLKRKEPTTLCVPGVETLHKSADIYGLISKKLKTSNGWCCETTGVMRSLSKIDGELDVLKDHLLPNVTPRKGESERRGNTSSTARVIRKANRISKLASALKRKKKVTGEVIGSELCKLINHDPPRYLKEHIPELIKMVEFVQDKPVWFYPSKQSSKARASSNDKQKP